MTEAIRLLSSPPATLSEPKSLPPSHVLLEDPFSSPSCFYTTDGHDSFPAPSAYLRNRHAWIHIFPEGRVHQHPHRSMRYFHWGVARLILEADVCPDIVPMWIEGTDAVLPEERSTPRWAPRPGKNVGIWIGDCVSGAEQERGRGKRVFGEMRDRWRALVEQERHWDPASQKVTGSEGILGIIKDEELRSGSEAVKLRMECAMEVRKLVLEVRRRRGLPDEDPKAGWADTWQEEGGRREGNMKDGSQVEDAT